MKPPSPRDHREAVALFRAEVVAALTHRPLSRGALRAELKALAAEGMDRPARAAALDPHARLRWQATHPGDVWQVDICHGESLRGPSGLIPVRVHAMIDDASRYIVGIEAMATERERDMLVFLAAAIRRHGFPAAIYLDNGSTYSGQALRVACERLGISLIHSTPREPQGRGKIERFFRTLREKCLNFTGTCSSLHEVNARLLAFLDRNYHTSPHAGLIGRTPASVWADGAPSLRPFDTALFAEAFTVRLPRRVRRDSTLELDGQTFEVAQGFLAGKRVEVAQRQIDGREAWVEHEGKRFELKPVNPQANATRPREARPARTKRVDFDPATTRLDRAMGRRPRKASDADAKTREKPTKAAERRKTLKENTK